MGFYQEQILPRVIDEALGDAEGLKPFSYFTRAVAVRR